MEISVCPLISQARLFRLLLHGVLQRNGEGEKKVGRVIGIVSYLIAYCSRSDPSVRLRPIPRSTSVRRTYSQLSDLIDRPPFRQLRRMHLD